jgi:hypothetical protein
LIALLANPNVLASRTVKSVLLTFNRDGERK